MRGENVVEVGSRSFPSFLRLTSKSNDYIVWKLAEKAITLSDTVDEIPGETFVTWFIPHTLAMIRLCAPLVLSVLACSHAFAPSFIGNRNTRQRQRHWGPSFLLSSNPVRAGSAIFAAPATSTESFIETELRGAAMRLHTREQAPKEGEAPAKKPAEPYVPTHADYLRFLVDSKHVYEAMEDIVNGRDELAVYRNTGLERTKALEKDIEFMVEEYGLERPSVGKPGSNYAEMLRKIESIPEFVCHYYNFYFAHTAGGRMIGKQMSSLLLEKKTLEFYKVRQPWQKGLIWSITIAGVSQFFGAFFCAHVR